MKLLFIAIVALSLGACAPKVEQRILEPYSGPKVVTPDRTANRVKDFGPANLIRVGGTKEELPKGCRRLTTTDADGTVDSFVSCIYD